MTYELLLGLIGFAFVSSITPGPNNMMLLASGANFGFRRTIPHMLGIGLGSMFMVFMVGLGLAEIFDTFPSLHVILKVGSVIYMFWLAWKIANSAPPAEGEIKGTPFTFLQAAAFQWVNPKAWAMALTAITVYSPLSDWVGALWVASMFGITNLPAVSAWTALGQQMRRLLTNAKRLRAFNWTMALLLILSLYPVMNV